MKDKGPQAKWEVKDPKGFMHVLQQDGLGYFGTENIGHCIDNHHERPYVVSRLLLEIDKHQEMGEWEGFAWLKI